MRLSHYAALAIAAATAVGAQERPGGPAAQPACMPPAHWYTLDTGRPQRADAHSVLRDAARQRVVLLGEQHDSVEDHTWQLQTLAALHVMQPRLVLGFEAFPRRLQPVLDRWVAGELTERQFLEQTEWDKVWRYPPSLYLPLFHFARINRIPMVALNVERTLTEAVGARGWDAVPADRKEGVSRPAAASADYEKTLYEVYLAHGKGHRADGAAGSDDPAFRRFVESQLTWDRAMAEALAARALGSSPGTPPLVVGIMGSGHLRHGAGVPHQLRDLSIAEVATLLPVDPADDCKALEAGLADAIFAAARAPGEPAPPPRLGIQLGSREGDVEIVAVTRGSLADRTGLRQGDRIVTLAGTPVDGAGAVIAAVRAQPAGTWLPVTVRRGEDTLELVIRFPPRT